MAVAGGVAEHVVAAPLPHVGGQRELGVTTRQQTAQEPRRAQVCQPPGEVVAEAAHGWLGAVTPEASRLDGVQARHLAGHAVTVDGDDGNGPADAEDAAAQGVAGAAAPADHEDVVAQPGQQARHRGLTHRQGRHQHRRRRWALQQQGAAQALDQWVRHDDIRAWKMIDSECQNMPLQREMSTMKAAAMNGF